MSRVLEEVEMLKRMKQGARRKTNGEMFKGDLRSRLNPPEDAVTYIDEVRGDAANRGRGESPKKRGWLGLKDRPRTMRKRRIREC